MGHIESNRAAAGKSPRGAHGGNGPPASLRPKVRATFATAPASRTCRASGSQALRPRSPRRRRARSNPLACRDRVRFRTGRHQGNAGQFTHIGAPRASPHAGQRSFWPVNGIVPWGRGSGRRIACPTCYPLGADDRPWYPRSGLIPRVLLRTQPDSPPLIIGTHKISTTPTPARG